MYVSMGRASDIIYAVAKSYLNKIAHHSGQLVEMQQLVVGFGHAIEAMFTQLDAIHSAEW